MSGRRPEDFRSELDDGFTEADPRIRARISDLIAPGDSLPSATPIAPEPEVGAGYVQPSGQVGTARRSALRWVAAATAALVLVGGGLAYAARRATPAGPLTADLLAQTAQGIAASNGESTVDVRVVGEGGEVAVTRIVRSSDGSITSTVISSTNPVASPPGTRDPAALIGGFPAARVGELSAEPPELLDAVTQQFGSRPTDPLTAHGLAELSAMSFLPPEVRSAAVAALGLAGGEPVDDPTGQGRAALHGAGWTAYLDPSTGMAVEFVEQNIGGSGVAVTSWTAS